MARIVLSEQTADKIQQMIDRQYKPGDKIPAEMELADFMNVSRTTIREAVKILCSRNILEIRRGYGTYVCENPGMPKDPLGSKEMDEEQLKYDIFEMSRIFEPELVRLSAQKADEKSIENIKELHEKMLVLLKRYRDGEYIHIDEFRKLDVEFHKAVIDAAGNQIITRSLPMFIASCSEWYKVWTSLDFEKALESFEKYHMLIIEALERHDGDSAYEYSKAHTQEIIEIYFSKRAVE